MKRVGVRLDGKLVGSLHRSLSPSKILISFEGAVKVAGLSAPPAERNRAPLVTLHEDVAAPAKPLLVPAPPPLAPAAERSLAASAGFLQAAPRPILEVSGSDNVP